MLIVGVFRFFCVVEVKTGNPACCGFEVCLMEAAGNVNESLGMKRVDIALLNASFVKRLSLEFLMLLSVAKNNRSLA
jgi:hypothetical protein